MSISPLFRWPNSVNHFRILFGSPKYEAKGEPVDGGFLDKKGAGEPMAPLPSAPSDGRAIEE
ncbi:hypothetical protein FR801_27030 (plasmid) [Citrobacter freundii]|nr:hypothetical protein FR801_27030 [Citrobacter freundii]